VSERSGDGWDGNIGGLCPVQGEGTVDGKPWYFRARGDRWSMYVAEREGADPVDVGFEEAGWMAMGDYGTWPEAGYMPDEDAWRFIGQVIGDFRAGKLARIEARAAARRQ
jgi:hypothetical protein